MYSRHSVMSKSLLLGTAIFCLANLGCSTEPQCESPSWSATVSEPGGSTTKLANSWAFWNPYADADQVELSTIDGLEINLWAARPAGANTLPPAGTRHVPDGASAAYWDGRLLVADVAVASGGTVTLQASTGLSLAGRFSLELEGQGALAGRHYRISGEFRATQLGLQACPGGTGD